MANASVKHTRTKSAGTKGAGASGLGIKTLTAQSGTIIWRTNLGARLFSAAFRFTMSFPLTSGLRCTVWSSLLFAPPPPPLVAETDVGAIEAVAETGVVAIEASHAERIGRTSGVGGQRSFVTAPDVIVMGVSRAECTLRTFRREASGLSVLFVSGCV